MRLHTKNKFAHALCALFILSTADLFAQSTWDKMVAAVPLNEKTIVDQLFSDILDHGYTVIAGAPTVIPGDIRPGAINGAAITVPITITVNPSILRTFESTARSLGGGSHIVSYVQPDGRRWKVSRQGLAFKISQNKDTLQYFQYLLVNRKLILELQTGNGGGLPCILQDHEHEERIEPIDHFVDPVTGQEGLKTGRATHLGPSSYKGKDVSDRGYVALFDGPDSFTLMLLGLHIEDAKRIVTVRGQYFGSLPFNVESGLGKCLRAPQ